MLLTIAISIGFLYLAVGLIARHKNKIRKEEEKEQSIRALQEYREYNNREFRKAGHILAKDVEFGFITVVDVNYLYFIQIKSTVSTTIGKIRNHNFKLEMIQAV